MIIVIEYSDKYSTYKISIFSLEPIDSKMYCIIKNNRSLIIDPCCSDEVFEYLSQFSIKDVTILLTHEHIDHISGVNELRSLYPCKVICSKACGDSIRDSRRNLSEYMESFLDLKNEEWVDNSNFKRFYRYTCFADQIFEEMLSLKWENLNIFCKELPGHSNGSIGILIDEKYFFSGDSLIKDCDTITALPGGNRKLYSKVTKPYVDSLEKEIIIFPGHGNFFSKIENMY